MANWRFLTVQFIIHIVDFVHVQRLPPNESRIRIFTFTEWPCQLNGVRQRSYRQRWWLNRRTSMGWCVKHRTLYRSIWHEFLMRSNFVLVSIENMLLSQMGWMYVVCFPYCFSWEFWRDDDRRYGFAVNIDNIVWPDFLDFYLRILWIYCDVKAVNGILMAGVRTSNERKRKRVTTSTVFFVVILCRNEPWAA